MSSFHANSLAETFVLLSAATAASSYNIDFR